MVIQMYCAHCGKKIQEGADVCLSCGYFVVKKSVVLNSNRFEPQQEKGKGGPIGFTFALFSLLCFFISFFLLHLHNGARPTYFIYLCPFLFGLLAILYSFEKKNLCFSCLHCISFIIGILSCLWSLFSLFYAIFVSFC